MNEQIINEFVLKARQQAVFDTDKYGKTFDLDLFHKKFAEAIVRECADIAKHHVMNISTYADADFVEEQIKQHFGVKE